MPVSRPSRSPNTAASEPRDRSLIGTMRIMDVAREVRKSRSSAAVVQVDPEFRHRLRANLVRTARQAGDFATEAEIDAAIDHYLANRHEYTPPRWSFSLVAAHLWVLRRRLLIATSTVLVCGVILWLLFVLIA